LKPCVDALQTNTYYPIHEVIVVDDGTPDRGGEKVEAYLNAVKPNLNYKIKLIARKENKGFVYTCNEGASAATGDSILFLNADTVPQGGWLAAMVNMLAVGENIGVVGARLLYPGINRIQHVGGTFDQNGKPIHIYKGQPAFLPFLNKDRALQWVTGACLLIRKGDFEAVGGFDPIFVSSSEDVDLCFKVRFNLGKEVRLAAGSILYHYTDVTGVTSQNIERTHPILLDRWKEHIVPDEAAIYESDGIAPEFLELMEIAGIYKDFGRVLIFMNALEIQTPEKQRRYSEKKGKDGFKQDLEQLKKQYPHLENRNRNLNHHQVQPAGTASLDKFEIQRQMEQLIRHNIEPAEKKRIFTHLAEKLEAGHFFTYMYNLASALKESGENHQAYRLFTFLAKDRETADPRLAGKAYYKMSELTDKTEEKIAYLRCTLQLMPEHQKAQKVLLKLEAFKTSKILRRLNDIPGNRPVSLYGAGKAGRNFLEILRHFRPDLKPKYFIDSYKQGTIDSLPVYSPAFIQQEIEGREELVLIVSIKWREIEETLREMGIKDYLVVPPRFLVPSGYRNLSVQQTVNPLENCLSHELFSPEDREQYREQLEAVEALLEQPEDRRLYRILTGRTEDGKSRLDALAEWYYQTRLKRQYFDYIDYGTVRTVIEGGVADGADTQAFIDTMKPGGKVYGFEPNIGDYLSGQYYKKQSANSAVAINPKGLWSHSGKLYFKVAGLSSSFTER